MCHFCKLSTVNILPRAAVHVKEALRGTFASQMHFQGKEIPLEPLEPSGRP